MANEEIAARLQSAVARYIGLPGTVHDLQRLTGGANRTTWSFDADIASARNQFIMQISSPRAGADEPNPLADISTHLTPAEDARLVTAAVKKGVPAPRVRAVLEPSDGLGDGYITERVEGETVAPRILREERFARARAVMAAQCGAILAAIHSIDLADAPFLKRMDAPALVAAQRRIADYYGFQSPALELGLRWAAEHAPAKARHTVVHGDFRLGNLIVGEEGIRLVLDWEIALSGDPMQDLGWLCVKTWRFGGPASGRRLRHPRGPVRGLREGQRSPCRSRARPLLGGLRQRKVGARMPATRHPRNRRGRSRAIGHRPPRRRAAMGFPEPDRRPRLTIRLTI